jgi:cytochrome b subunit of formate dehydrogenase
MHWLKRTIRIIFLLLSAITGAFGVLTAFVLTYNKGANPPLGRFCKMLHIPSFLALPMMIISGGVIGFWAIWFFYWAATKTKDTEI